MPKTWLLRGITDPRASGDGFTARMEAVATVPAGELGGWLTGEPLADQGIENLPNLPNLDLPEVTTRHYTLTVEFPAADTARILLTPEGRFDRAHDPTWLGIVTAPRLANGVEVRVHESPDEIVVSGGEVSVCLGRNPFTLAVSEGDSGEPVLRTGQRLRQATGLPMCPPVLVSGGELELNLELGADEEITGFGEQFGRFVHNGKRLRLSCTDALGTATGYAYKPVPVWHSGRGYTALLNTGTTVTADVEHTRPGAMSVRLGDELLDLHVTVGASGKRRLASYTDLTGRPEVPPPWAFGFWLGRCRYHSAEEMLAVARGARERDIPLDVLHCDPDWLVTDRLNCDFHWNHDRFGDRARFVTDLDDLGVRLSLWELPYLDPASPWYAEAEAGEFLVHDTSGAVAEVEGTPSPDQRPRALVDLTGVAGKRWWQGMHEPFLDDGVAAFKTDFAEGCPHDAVLADGTPPTHAHNLYPLRYNAAVSEVIRTRTGRPALVWARSGWAGSQRYPAQWGGDAESSVAGMRATVRAGLSFGISAPGLWSHDVGGFFGPGLTPGLYVRWTQLGALSPLMRAHGLSAREPWAWDERTLSIARHWLRLRYSLVPYLWQVAHEAARDGLPMMRPLGLEYPADPVAPAVDGQFFLGADLLVVPVFDAGDEPVVRRFYVPAGAWTDIETGLCLHGPGWHDVDVPLERMPVLARGGTAIPRLDPTGARNVDDVLARPWTLHTYGAAAGEYQLVGFDRSPTVVRIDGADVRVDGTQPISPSAVRSRADWPGPCG